MDMAPKNMNNFTETMFCSPADAETAKRDLNLNLNFRFIVGNYTPWEPYGSTGMRTMPFSLCCYPIAEPCRILVQAAGCEDREVIAGQAFFIPEGVRHNLRDLAGHEINSLWIHFRLTMFHALNVFDFFDTPLFFSGAAAADLRRQLDLLVRLPRMLDLADSLRLQLAGMSLAGELLTEARLKPERLTVFRHLDRLRPVFELLAHRTPEAGFPSGAELADRIGLSQSRFLAIFHEATGGSPTAFFERQRHLRACELLLSSTRTLAEIAAELNYSDAFHFSRKFKSQTGMSPKQFRQAGIRTGAE